MHYNNNKNYYIHFLIMILYIKQITYLNSFLVFFTVPFSIETINYNFFPIRKL